MNKGLEQFENRNDDWLAKERNEESKVSAWDFDEGRKIREFHETNCEAREIKENHERLHTNYIRQNKMPKKNSSSGFISIIFILIGFNIVSSIFFEKEFSLISPIIIFVFIIAVVSMIKTKGKINK